MMAKGVLFTLPTMTAMAVVPVHHPGGEVSLGDCESRCDESTTSHSRSRQPYQVASDQIQRGFSPRVGSLFAQQFDFGEDPGVPPLPRSANETLGRAPFDVTAYVSKYVDALHFLPSDPRQPVRLFTLSGCTSRVVTLTGRVRGGVAAYGLRTFRRTKAVLTGTEPPEAEEGSAPSGRHVAGGRAVPQQDVPDTYIESTNPAEALTPDQQRQASLDRLAAELYPRRLWSFARCEAAAEALLRRKEREWRKMVDFAVDARAQAGAAARALLEAALRKLNEAPIQDVTAILAELQRDLASVHEWFTEERAFVEEGAHFAVANGTAIPPVTANPAEIDPSAPQNQYARLLEENPGAKRFLKRAAARRRPSHVLPEWTPLAHRKASRFHGV